ncbi:hypothetical protein LCGC14_2307820, partial [marine sediment metagenome]
SRRDRGFWNPLWKVEKWMRRGLLCGTCSHQIDEPEADAWGEFGLPPKLLVSYRPALLNARGEEVPGTGGLFATCPECAGTMHEYSPDHDRGRRPDEVLERVGNLLLNEGIAELWDIIAAAGGTTLYDNTNADLGVGNSTTAAAATQTDLQGASKAFKGMEATYPLRSSETLDFKAQYTSGEANFAWEEVSARNGNTRNKNLNRLVTALGTKSGGTWTLTLSVTLS